MQYEVNQAPVAVNYRAQSLFDTSFLNYAFYSNLPMQDPAREKRVALGRTLFFDPIMSKDMSTSCGSCHQPEYGFADASTKTSFGKVNADRNTPSLLYSVFSDTYFWDARETKLDRQMLHVVTNPHEFDTDITTILDRINQSNTYRALFLDAYSDYGAHALTQASITDALSNYISSLYAFNSPVDQYIRGEIGVLDTDVQAGFNLFMGKAACGSCHFAPTFNGTTPPLYQDTETEVLGVPVKPDTINAQIDPDQGRYVNNLPSDRAEFYRHSFKTPTVRNVALTAPYMHNGAYKTLDQVIDFYHRGGGDGIGAKLENQTLPFDNLELTETEKKQLVKFMEALTDNTSNFTEPTQLPQFENKPEWNARKALKSY